MAELKDFKNGRYYSPKENGTWAVNISGPYGLSVDTRVIHKGDRLQYYEGRLVIDGMNSEYIMVSDKHLDKFEPYYFKDQLEKWVELRLQYAGQAMQVLMQRAKLHREGGLEEYVPYQPEDVAKMAFEYADAMIDKLKDEI